MTGKFTDHIKGALALILFFILLTGCGGGFVDLSEDESKQIVNYSTNVLNDHNAAVKGSLQNLSKTDLRDIVIKDDLTPFFEAEGEFIIIKDWDFPKDIIGNSSVFRFEIGKHPDVLENFYNEDKKVLIDFYL